MSHIGYILKVYPRFSETFVVTEILAREAQGERLSIYALRPTTDSRFHPEIARVKAPVSWPPRHRTAADMWAQMAACLDEPATRERFAQTLPLIADLDGADVAQAVALAAQAKADAITHLHAHFATLAARTAWIVNQLTAIPYTITTHAKDIYHESVDPVWLRRVCAGAERVIAISRFNEAHLRQVLAGSGAKVCLRYNALELERFPYHKPLSPKGGLRLAAVGRLVPKKGFDDLLDALAELVQTGVPVKAVIAGEGQLGEHLRQRVAALGLSQHVTMPGALTQAEVRDLLRGSHALVVPCVPGEDGNIDGLPTVVLEAMATGTPVVATDVTGMHEVVQDGVTGVLLPPAQPGLLAQALRDLAEGRTEITALSRNARALIERDFDSRCQAAVLARWQRADKEAG